MKIAFDSSVSFGLSKDDWEWLDDKVKKSQLEIWDSPVALFEIIGHVNTSDCDIGNKKEWVQNKTYYIKKVTGNQMLPHPGLVVRRAIREWLGWCRQDSDLKEEVLCCLKMRNSFASGIKDATSDEVRCVLIKPLTEAQNGFQTDLMNLKLSFTNTENEKLRNMLAMNKHEFIATVTKVIQNDQGWQNELFSRLMLHHGVMDDEKDAIALNWNKVPFVKRLMRLYCLQIACFVKSGRNAERGDFIDFEWAPYIVCERIDYFVTNNKRDFQNVLKKDDEFAAKIKNWQELKTIL